MNALVGIRANMGGFNSPTKAARTEAEKDINANLRANVLGKMLDGKTLQKVEESSTRELSDAELGRETFLELLMNQIKYQDPMEPMDNSEMVAQLAQFSSLEQMSNLNDTMETLGGNIDQLNFISGGSLLGRTVTGMNTSGVSITGVVEKVELEGSLVYLTVNGERVSMAGVRGIT